MDFNTKLRQILVESIKKIGYQVELDSFVFAIDIPKDSKNGDYATNIALQLSKAVKGNPKAIAEDIKKAIDLSKNNLERIEIAGPGFINFFVSKTDLANNIKDILSLGSEYGKRKLSEQLSYNVEFISANPTGRLHLGHARQAALGDSLCRILQAAGYKVVREYYVNDLGSQVHNLALSVKARYLELHGLPFSIPEDGYFGEDIKLVAQELKKKFADKFVNDDSKETLKFIRDFSIEEELYHIRNDLKNFRVEMDIFSSEHSIKERGLVEQTLQILKEVDVLYELDGATFFKSTQFGDDKDRVLIKSDKMYTYLTPDIAYHVDKLSRGYDFLVNLLGADHHGYINRLKAAIMALGHDKNKLEIDIVQMVRLIKDGEEYKMSKRAGNAITLSDIVEEVGIDAARYFFVSRSGDSHFDFDINLAKTYSNDNPVYYAQYAHARMNSIINQSAKIETKEVKDFDLLVAEQEIDLIKKLVEFKQVIIEAAKSREPYLITIYIQKVAQLFHSFYNECRVVDENNLNLSAQRLLLVVATKTVLANALNLIGVSAPQSM
jgi:arginyl-tRNA synthetase